MSTLAFSLIASLLACGEKSGTTSAPAAAAATKFTMDLPDDATSRSFAETLVGGVTTKPGGDLDHRSTSEKGGWSLRKKGNKVTCRR